MQLDPIVHHRPERRRHPRISVAMRGALIFAAQREECRIFNLSESGAGVTCPALPPRLGAVVDLFIDGRGWFPARVARMDHTTLGLEFLLRSPQRRALRELVEPRIHTIH
ncbi:MAG: PilZ domain-containing protein [Alphaproteobacteria bacterium]|nr:PilZ domain-containing protein [Alphaproteobacteria bacterium]